MVLPGLLRSKIKLPPDVFTTLLSLTTTPTATSYSLDPLRRLAARPLSPPQRRQILDLDDAHDAFRSALRYNEFTPEEVLSLNVDTFRSDLANDLLLRYAEVDEVLRFVILRMHTVEYFSASLRAPITVLDDDHILQLLNIAADVLVPVGDSGFDLFRDLIEIRPHLIPRILRTTGRRPELLREAVASSAYAANPKVLEILTHRDNAGHDLRVSLNNNPVVPTRIRERCHGTDRHRRAQLRSEIPFTVSSDFASLTNPAHIALIFARATAQDDSPWDGCYPQPWDLLKLAQNPNLRYDQALEIAQQLCQASVLRRCTSTRVDGALDALVAAHPALADQVAIESATRPSPLPIEASTRMYPIDLDLSVAELLEEIKMRALVDGTLSINQPPSVSTPDTLDTALASSPINWLRFLRQLDLVPDATTLREVASTVLRATKADSRV